MEIQGIYAALATADLDRAEKFYTHLFGRSPDDRPMESLVQWRDVSGANVQVFHDPKTAGFGRLTVVVPDMARARETLGQIGIKPTGEAQGDYGRIAQIADPDGNMITLAEPPSKPFRK